MTDTLQISLAIIALIGVVVAPVISGILNDRQERRRERHAYIDATVQALITVRANLQAVRIYGHAIATFPDEYTKAETEAQRLSMREELMRRVESPEYREIEANFGRAYAIMVSLDDPEIRARAPELLDDRLKPTVKFKVIDFALEQLGKQYKFKL